MLELKPVRSAVLLLSGLLVPVSADAQVTLRMKFTPDESIRYRVEQTTKTEFEINGTPVTSDMQQTMTIRTTTREVTADGIADQTTKLERIRTTNTLPPPLSRTIEVDTDEELPADPLAAAMARPIYALAKAEYQVQMSNRGEIVHVELPQSVLDAFNSLPGAGTMGGMFSEDGLKQQFSQSSLVLPEESVKPGDRWSVEPFALPLPFGKFKVTQEFEVVSVDKATRQVKIKLDPVMSVEPAPGAPFQIEVKDSQAEGFAMFDAGMGRLVSSTLEQIVQMELTIKGQPPRAMTISTTVNVTDITGLADEEADGKATASSRSESAPEPKAETPIKPKEIPGKKPAAGNKKMKAPAK